MGPSHMASSGSDAWNAFIQRHERRLLPMIPEWSGAGLVIGKA